MIVFTSKQTMQQQYSQAEVRSKKRSKHVKLRQELTFHSILIQILPAHLLLTSLFNTFNLAREDNMAGRSDSHKFSSV